MTFGGGAEGIWGKIGQLQQGEAERIVGSAVDAGINFIDTADVYSAGRSEEITGQAMTEPQAGARQRRRRDQGVRRDRRGREPARRDAQPHHLGAEGEPAPAAARPRRPVPDPRLRSGDADRGDGARARHHGRARPRALRRRLELGGVADHEGGRHRRAARPGALREPAGVLHDRRSRPRARAGADAAERGHRPDGLEPARRRLPQRQVRPRPEGRGRRPPHRVRLPAGRQGARLRRHRRDARESRPGAASRWRRSRSPGCCTSRR